MRKYIGNSTIAAIDITSEAAAASKVLWEWTNGDVGYTFGRPIITKTRAFGGRWLVVVPSGYNNASGVGRGCCGTPSWNFWVSAKSRKKGSGAGSGSPTCSSATLPSANIA